MQVINWKILYKNLEYIWVVIQNQCAKYVGEKVKNYFSKGRAVHQANVLLKAVGIRPDSTGKINALKYQIMAYSFVKNKKYEKSMD
jgi:hypothetical protein